MFEESSFCVPVREFRPCAAICFVLALKCYFKKPLVSIVFEALCSHSVPWQTKIRRNPTKTGCGQGWKGLCVRWSVQGFSSRAFVFLPGRQALQRSRHCRREARGASGHYRLGGAVKFLFEFEIENEEKGNIYNPTT